MFSQEPLKYSDLELLGVSENHHGEGGSGDEREGGECPLLLAPGPVLLAVLGDHALGKARIEVERDISAHLLILQIHCEPSQIFATCSKSAIPNLLHRATPHNFSQRTTTPLIETQEICNTRKIGITGDNIAIWT